MATKCQTAPHYKCYDLTTGPCKNTNIKNKRKVVTWLAFPKTLMTSSYWPTSPAAGSTLLTLQLWTVLQARVTLCVWICIYPFLVFQTIFRISSKIFAWLCTGSFINKCFSSCCTRLSHMFAFFSRKNWEARNSNVIAADTCFWIQTANWTIKCFMIQLA